MSEHPFAHFIRILGKGKKGSRSLTLEEAEMAMSMILGGQSTPEQTGAFLMLVRVKEECPEELAGFIRAARLHLSINEPTQGIDLDWSSYAGKRRHPPWFLLSARLLAGQGIRILIHGSSGNKDNRIYSGQAIRDLDMPVCQNGAEIDAALASGQPAYVALNDLCPALQNILDLRRILGLRSPINTLLRMLNPFSAPHLIQGIFHPAYRSIHQQAALLLGQSRMIVFKGEGGEPELNPDAPCQLLGVNGKHAYEESWPAIFERRHIPGTLTTQRVKALWEGTSQDEYGRAAVIGTTAIALRLLDQAQDYTDAWHQAESMWASRHQP